jgi:hypothetical protein
LLRAGVCVCVCVLAVLALAQAGGARGEEEEEEEEDWKIESVLARRGDEQPWHATVGWWLGKWGVREGKECEEHYGIMPCSTSLGGNAALLVAYGFMLLKAAQLLSDGSELLLEVVSPGIIGGLVLPILGAFPDALLITGELPPPLFLQILGSSALWMLHYVEIS